MDDWDWLYDEESAEASGADSGSFALSLWLCFWELVIIFLLVMA